MPHHKEEIMLDLILDAQDKLNLAGLGEQGWRVVVDRHTGLRRRLGHCRYEKKEIGISQFCIKYGNVDLVRDVLTHEIAHALTPGDQHGMKWKAMAKRLGLQKPRASIRLANYGVRDSHFIDDFVIFAYTGLNRTEFVSYSPKMQLELLESYIKGRKPSTIGKLVCVDRLTWEAFEAKEITCSEMLLSSKSDTVEPILKKQREDAIPKGKRKAPTPANAISREIYKPGMDQRTFKTLYRKKKPKSAESTITRQYGYAMREHVNATN